MDMKGIWKIFTLIFKKTPMCLIVATPKVAVDAILPFLLIYFPRQVIDALVRGEDYGTIVRIIIIFSLLLLILQCFSHYLSSIQNVYIEKFSLRLREDIGSIAMRLPLADIEQPEKQVDIHLAGKISSVTGVISIVQQIIAGVITVVGLSIILSQLDWWVLFVATITVVVKVVTVKIQLSFQEKNRKLHAKNDRVGNYLMDVAYFNQSGIKELRIHSARAWFLEKVYAWRGRMVQLHMLDFRLQAFMGVISALAVAVQSLLVLWLLSTRFLSGEISIADFTMYIAAIASITFTLSRITELLGEYGQHMINFGDFEVLMSAKDLDEKNNCGINKEERTSQGFEIVFENVSFAYPGSHKNILNNINVTICSGEKLMIAGFNGAGKSTLVKLLCRFYRPTTGRITLNGADIWKMPEALYYNYIGAVFQDFMNLPFSIKENVSMEPVSDTIHVLNLLERVGLKAFISSQPAGIDTYITRLFNEGGIELSGGEAQKVAIARALYKNSPLLIFDEPTASLDPQSEGEIYDRFFNVAKDKAIVFISHRLAAATIADRIIVLDEGKIAETGTHEMLLKRNGLYAEMFEAQSLYYQYS